MATAVQDAPAAQVAQALVDFSLSGAFPEEDVSSLRIDPAVLPEAIKALANAKAALQVREYPVGLENSFGSC